MKKFFVFLGLFLALTVDSFAAFSCTKVSRTLAGTKVMEIWALNFASVTSGSCCVGLGDIEFAKFNNEVTEDAGLLKRNTSTGSDVARGCFHVSAVTSSDTGTALVIGR